MPRLGNEVNRAIEIVTSQQKELHDVYEAVCGQNAKLAVLINQILLTGMLNRVLLFFSCNSDYTVCWDVRYTF